MEKRKSILDQDSMKRKLAKLPEKERKEVERRIVETEAMVKKEQRKEQALMRMPKEERLKKIYGQHLKNAFDHGVEIGQLSMTEGSKMSGQYFQREAWKQLRPGLTNALKKAAVLPLGN